MKELEMMLNTFENNTRYDAEQIALRYAELAVKEERERIIGIIESIPSEADFSSVIMAGQKISASEMKNAILETISKVEE